jgi:hypothetical protein
MSAILRSLLLAAVAEDTKVSLNDIESRLRTLQGGAQKVVSDSRQNAVVAAAAGGLVLLVITYLLGRRRGRRRATFLEIRRG